MPADRMAKITVHDPICKGSGDPDVSDRALRVLSPARRGDRDYKRWNPRPPASHVMMVRREVRTGFEWLDTPFLLTRTLCTLWGACMAILFFSAFLSAVDEAWRHLVPAPAPAPDPGGAGEEEIHVRSSCGMERSPFAELAVAFRLSVLPVLGMILVWRKPKLGFRVAAGGWLWVVLAPVLANPSSTAKTLDWRYPALLLLPPLWLGFAAARVPMPGPTDSDRVVPVEEPRTDFEWMDAAFEWLVAPGPLAGLAAVALSLIGIYFYFSG